MNYISSTTWIKRFLLFIIILAGFSTASFAQTDSTSTRTPTAAELYPEGVKVPRYKLYPTENMWIHLKLDTAKGIVWMVQYSINGDKGRLEKRITFFAQASGDRAVPGRFELYPTQNMYNFIMLDTIDGSTYQVQWSIGENYGIMIIQDNSMY